MLSRMLGNFVNGRLKHSHIIVFYPVFTSCFDNLSSEDECAVVDNFPISASPFCTKFMT